MLGTPKMVTITESGQGDDQVTVLIGESWPTLPEGFIERKYNFHEFNFTQCEVAMLGTEGSQGR